jgi:phosphoenolpyruvate synthase/pyruvate phosphate dikinase
MHMKSNFIMSLCDEFATIEQVGGKGASLRSLAAANLPVPPGFYITTAAYHRFVADHGLQEEIMDTLAPVTPSEPATLEQASRRITQLFIEHSIADDMVEEIRRAYAELGEGDTPVAVRSSATAEDLPEASFAGQQETYLNIHGADEVLDAVKKCWASLWTARAIAYRFQNKIDQKFIALGVVVQKLVFADASGIMFTANPVNGNRDEVIINAAWGLGEAIVGGAVTPDTVLVSKPKKQVIHRETTEKQLMTVRIEQGTQEQAVPYSMRKKAVLSDALAVKLAQIGIKIEELYGTPMDIEWTLKGSQFAIIQARPITSLPEEPLEWTTRAVKAVIMARGSFAEFVPDPVSPLFATLAVPIAQDETRKMMADFVGIKEEDSYIFEVINGYVYVGMKVKYLLKMIITTIAYTKKMLQNSKERWGVVRDRSRRVANKWQVKDLATLSAAELMKGAREIFTTTAEYYTIAQSGPIPAALSSEVTFGRFYNLLVKRKGDPAFTTFLLGIENLPLRAEKSLYDLAMWAGEQAELADYIKKTPSETICSALQADPIPTPLSGGFSDRFAAHLDEFGHTLYDLDFAKSVPADDPLPLVDALKAYLAGKGVNPHERQKNQILNQEQAEQKITKRHGPLRRKWFLKLLNWAKDNAPDREDCISDMGLGYPQLRRLLKELGQRLTVSGTLTQPEDIYWLEAQEIDALAASLERGTRLPNYSALVESRRSFWHKARSVTPPTTLPERSWLSRFLVHDNPEGKALKGYGASAGKITAPACVMRGPDDFDLMHPGDVIVAVTTTPAWTPLFAVASAVVTDIGGPLSHSSIVAREYGIPAVMATGVASKRIFNGQMITVDGGTGIVSLN